MKFALVSRVPRSKIHFTYDKDRPLTHFDEAELVLPSLLHIRT